MSMLRPALNFTLTHIGILTSEQDRLVELSDSLRNVDDVSQHAQCRSVLFMGTRRAVVVGRQVRSNASNCAEKENGVEVDVLQAFRV